MKEFLNQNPDYKKQPKEIQNQRYELYEEQRQNNIKRCIMKRQEIISNTKKVKPSPLNYRTYDAEESDEDEDINIHISNSRPIYNLKNSEYNYYLRKNFSTNKKKTKLEKKNKILITDKSYIMNNSLGTKSEITKDDIGKFTCIKNEKEKLDKKSEEKDDHLKKYLNVELNRAKKLKKVKSKLNQKDEKLKKFIDIKKNGIKLMENDRYKDSHKILERQKLYEKMLSNYEQKVFVTKQQQLEESNTINSNKKSMRKTKMKMEELKEQIKEYEKKNNEYKQKITNMFDLKEKDEIDKKIREKIEKKDKKEDKKEDKNNKEELTSSVLMQKKINDLEEKFEIEKLRRENALMVSMNKFQDKINTFLEKNEEKEQKIKNAIIKVEKEREEKRMKRSNHLNEVKENIKNNEKKKETKRLKLLETIEKKNLKDFAIKQEKLKMYEQRKKMNKLNKEEREALKIKIQEIIKNEDNIDENEKNEDIINNLINEKNEK